MLEITNTEVFGLERAIKAISNSYTVGEIDTTKAPTSKQYEIANSLGSNTECFQSHDAFLRGIIVEFDVKYPQYWTPEFQRYHFVEIIMSQSTMHSLKKMLSDDKHNPYNKYVSPETKEIIAKLAKEYENDPSYENFIRLRSNLPAGFELSETIVTNYKQLKTIWVQRHNHKLKEDWGTFCNWIESLPKFKELCLDELLNSENKKKQLIKNHDLGFSDECTEFIKHSVKEGSTIQLKELDQKSLKEHYVHVIDFDDIYKNEAGEIIFECHSDKNHESRLTYFNVVPLSVRDYLKKDNPKQDNPYQLKVNNITMVSINSDEDSIRAKFKLDLVKHISF